MKKVIISGANGFIGSSVVKELIKNGIEVIALCTPKHTNNIPDSSKVTICTFDLRKPYKLTEKLKNINADTFFHFAWIGVDVASRSDTSLQLENAQLTVECIKAAKQIGCRRFIGAGSIMEKETLRVTLSNGSRPGTNYIYGAGKLAAHSIGKAVAAEIGIDFIWAILTNAYGPGEKSTRMVNTTIQKCIRREPPQFTSGMQNYDFVYIDDVARGMYLIGEKGKPFYDYVIGSSNAKSLKEFLLEMKVAIAPDLEFLFGDIPYTGVNLPLEDFDCSSTEEDTGFKAKISFYEGCKRTKEWWQRTWKEE